jgi:DNA-binding MarR family transcriptional regulator/GNAT superfamily N-acetyltransferase
MPTNSPHKAENAEAQVAAVRRFNRYYTRQIGLLRKRFLDSPYSLGEARVLHEIATKQAATASDVAKSLDLDAGYLSRVLRNFEKHGLIRRRASLKDGRQSYLSLTPRGRKSYLPLDARSQRATASMLVKLAPEDQTRLIAAMATIETLLEGQAQNVAPQRSYSLRAPRPGDFGWIVKRNAKLYARDYGWREPFEGVCAQIVADFVNKYDTSRERGWIAELDGENVGAVMLANDGDGVARLRLLFVEPKARGLGIGARLVDEVVRFARTAGYRKITLWTHSVLAAARHIYQNAGFKLMRSEEHRSWGQPVVSEHWDLEL